MMVMTSLVLSIYVHMYNYVEVKKQKRKQSEQRRLQRKRSQKTDENAIYGPPDKQQQFETENTTGHKKKK